MILLTGRLRNAQVLSELMYTSSNLLVFLNDAILRQSAKLVTKLVSSEMSLWLKKTLATASVCRKKNFNRHFYNTYINRFGGTLHHYRWWDKGHLLILKMISSILNLVTLKSLSYSHRTSTIMFWHFPDCISGEAVSAADCVGICGSLRGGRCC